MLDAILVFHDTASGHVRLAGEQKELERRTRRLGRWSDRPTRTRGEAERRCEEKSMRGQFGLFARMVTDEMKSTPAP
jgi:DNA-binding IclR family transcriptional regulator